MSEFSSDLRSESDPEFKKIAPIFEEMVFMCLW